MTAVGLPPRCARRPRPAGEARRTLPRGAAWIGALAFLGAASPLSAQEAPLPAQEAPVCDAAVHAVLDDAAAEVPEPAVLEALVGAWEGSGTLFGGEATFRMRWTPIFDGRFLELRYEIAGAYEMEAQAYYRRDAEPAADPSPGARITGIWLDSRGEILDLEAVWTASSLVTAWTAPTERGRTVYRLVGRDALEVCDFVADGSGWRPFGAARYRRAGG